MLRRRGLCVQSANMLFLWLLSLRRRNIFSACGRRSDRKRFARESSVVSQAELSMSEQSADPLLDAFLEHTEKHGLLNEEQLQAAIREKPMEEPWLITSNYGRADLTLHPLVREAYKVACLIEMCGASEALTRASCAAFALTES